MNKIILGFAVIFILFTGCDSQKVFNRVTENNNNKMLVGSINKAGLLEKPFKEWFEPEYYSYKMDSALIKPLRSGLRLYRFEVFLGTWCSDSQREIPRFFKILETVEFATKQRADFFAVNTKKQSFLGEEIGKNIIKVPTIIVYRNNKEVNRIVEFPVSESLEMDLYNIISGNEYIPNYSED